MEEDLPKGDNPNGSDKATSAAQDIPGDKSQAAHGVVTAPPKSLSVVSSLTDSDPPSPTGPESGATGTTENISVSSSLPSSVTGMSIFVPFCFCKWSLYM